MGRSQNCDNWDSVRVSVVGTGKGEREGGKGTNTASELGTSGPSHTTHTHTELSTVLTHTAVDLPLSTLLQCTTLSDVNAVCSFSFSSNILKSLWGLFGL